MKKITFILMMLVALVAISCGDSATKPGNDKDNNDKDNNDKDTSEVDFLKKVKGKSLNKIDTGNGILTITFNTDGKGATVALKDFSSGGGIGSVSSTYSFVSASSASKAKYSSSGNSDVLPASVTITVSGSSIEIDAGDIGVIKGTLS